MSTQLMTSNFLEDLSAEQQQLLSGGVVGKDSGEGDSGEEDSGEESPTGSGRSTTSIFRVRTRSIISVSRVR